MDWLVFFSTLHGCESDTHSIETTSHLELGSSHHCWCAIQSSLAVPHSGNNHSSKSAPRSGGKANGMPKSTELVCSGTRQVRCIECVFICDTSSSMTLSGQDPWQAKDHLFSLIVLGTHLASRTWPFHVLGLNQLHTQLRVWCYNGKNS
jgi:hypothetical protein